MALNGDWREAMRNATDPPKLWPMKPMRSPSIRLSCASLPVASAILNEVSDQGADILIMGGYGHSRLRQLVWGGVTSEILGSMTVPVFMAH